VSHFFCPIVYIVIYEDYLGENPSYYEMLSNISLEAFYNLKVARQPAPPSPAPANDIAQLVDAIFNRHYEDLGRQALVLPDSLQNAKSDFDKIMRELLHINFRISENRKVFDQKVYPFVQIAIVNRIMDLQGHADETDFFKRRIKILWDLLN